MDTAKTHGSDAPTGEVKKKKRTDKTLIPARTKKARKTAASKKKKAVSLFGDDIMPAAKAKKHAKRKSKKSKREKYCWWALPVSCLCLLVVAVVITLGIRESQNYDLNCLAPSEPYLSIAPMAVSPLMLAFSRLMSLSRADLKVMSS